MKRFFIIAFICLTTGCGVVLRSPSSIANKVRIGMSVAEFKKLAGPYAVLDAMTTDYSIYRVEHFAGPEDNRYISSVKRYHFDSKGRLFEVETRDFAEPFRHPFRDFEPLNP